MIRDPHLHRRTMILFAAAVAAMPGCTGGIDPTPSITLSINPTSATVVQGGSVAIGATLIGSGGFSGTGATFALTGAPAGVTFEVSHLQTRGSETTATIWTSVAATVPPGTYALGLTGSGTGVRAVSASFALTVPVPSIAISISPASATVAQGGSVAIGATLTGSGGFTGAGATFALAGAPAGVTFEVSNLETRPYSVTTATITTSVAATVPLGTYALDLTGSWKGVSPVAAPFALTVAAVGFTLSVSPATLDLCEGCGAGTATITISRVNDFTGSVLLSVSSPPVGQGGSFSTALDPTSATGNSSILTVSTNAPPGDYTLTITGTAPGLPTQTITIAVTVW